MTLSADDLDPDVAAALAQAGKKKNAPVKSRSGQGTGTFFSVVGLLLGVFLLSQEPEWHRLGLMFLCSAIALFIITQIRKSPGAQRESVNRRGAVYSAESLSKKLSQTKLNEVERDYVGALIALLTNVQPVDEASRRHTLQVMNGLLSDYRRLKGERKRLEAALKADETGALRDEVKRLNREIKNTHDPVVVSSKRQALRMVEQRITDAEAGGQVIQRLEAQEEAVAQTLATLRVSLLRLANTATTPQINNGEIDTLVAEVSRQTRSIEQAVQEVEAVLTVRNGL